MILDDEEPARLTDTAEMVCDFHALRHTWISRLVSSEASVKVCHALARRSSPTLMIGRYAHVRLHDLRRTSLTLLNLATGCNGMPRNVTLRPAGPEPATPGLGNRCSESVNDDATTGCATGGAALTDLLTELFRKDAELAAVVTAWPGLPDAVRARILGIVEGVAARDGGT